jgi:hypothetical protein
LERILGQRLGHQAHEFVGQEDGFIERDRDICHDLKPLERFLLAAPV